MKRVRSPSILSPNYQNYPPPHGLVTQSCPLQRMQTLHPTINSQQITQQRMQPSWPTHAWQGINRPQPLSIPNAQALHNLHYGACTSGKQGSTLEGLQMKSQNPMTYELPQRGKDRKKRSNRACALCKSNNNGKEYLCNGRGRGGRAACDYFNIDSTPKD